MHSVNTQTIPAVLITIRTWAIQNLSTFEHSAIMAMSSRPRAIYINGRPRVRWTDGCNPVFKTGQKMKTF
jgi:hypothetical protein